MLQKQPKWVQRVVIIVVTMVVALIARTIAVTLFGVDFVSNGGELGHEAIDVGIRPILVVPGIAGLLGWLALTVLERVAAARSAVIWTIGAVAVFVLATIPLFPWDMSSETKATLLCFHVLVAAVYIPLMLRTTRP